MGAQALINYTPGKTWSVLVRACMRRDRLIDVPRQWPDNVGSLSLLAPLFPLPLPPPRLSDGRSTRHYRHRHRPGQSWALSVFLNFFTNKKLFFAFSIKLI